MQKRTLIRVLAAFGVLAALAICLVTVAPASDDVTRVRMETSLGEFTLELYPDKAPQTVANFLTYVRDGYYEGTVFHRVIAQFMIQGGGYDADLTPKGAMKPIRNEASNGLKNEAYTIAMARTSNPHSATSQFFINAVDNPGLDYVAPTAQGYGYCVFGKVVNGRDVVDAIRKVRVATRGFHENVPVTPVTITKATVLE